MVDSSPPNAEKLAEFFQSTERQMTPELKEILEVVATSGKVWHDWEHLRVLVAVQMDGVLETYNKSRLAVDVGPPRPLLGGESLEGLQGRLHALLEAIPGPPFTIQRLCEVLLWPHETYASIDKLALAFEKLMMVTQTIARSTDPYPELPLPPHQPPPLRKTPPQPMQPRLSFGHQPHPEANPDQLEEHELNAHQNQSHQGNHHMHRNDNEQKSAMPSFLEADGPVPRHLEEVPRHSEGPAAAPLENVFGGAEKSGEQGEKYPPVFFGAADQLENVGLGHVEAHGPLDGAGRKRSFDETTRQGNAILGQVGEVVPKPETEHGVFYPTVEHQPMVVDSVGHTLLPEVEVAKDTPPLIGTEASSTAHKEDDTSLETLLKPGPSDLASAAHVDMPRGEDSAVDGASATNSVANPTAADPSIEPMTPPSVLKDGPDGRSLVMNPENPVGQTTQNEELDKPT